MRGARGVGVDRAVLGGIIPAYAGSTAGCTSCPTSAGDHPRGCGEHKLKPPASSVVAGSSPRMRGTRNSDISKDKQRRIIPADAGNTRRYQTQDNPIKDHPRGCGEHALGSPDLADAVGSSPRMRGTPAYSSIFAADSGIIPADAGNTQAMNSRLKAWPDHPRGCGEHQLAQDQNLTNSGSSPRMRGTPKPWAYRKAR